jgi:putative ABC transport system permease protein
MLVKLATPLAWLNLTHDVRRLGVAVSGVTFAVSLIFMELGFLNALLESTVQIFRRLEGEIVLVSPAQYALIAAERFDLRRIYDARAVAGVASVSPVYIETTAAILRTTDQRGYPIRVLAVRPEDDVLAVPELALDRDELAESGTALADVTSRKKFGFFSGDDALAAYQGELNGKRLRLVGRFHLGVDFSTDGNLLMTAANFANFFPGRAGGHDPLSRVDLGVVRLEPGADARQVASELRRALPPDVVPLLKDRLIRREMNFWRTNAPLGYIFMVGAVMGFIVGVLICYQIIHADITDHMREFATLKAMGYKKRFFIFLVLRQCLYLSFLGFLPGAFLSYLAYAALASITGLTMHLTLSLALLVLAATTLMCTLSGLLAISKLLSLDPAELF